MAVREYGRGLFLVTSATRPGLVHLVDFEPELTDEGAIEMDGEPYQCSCEAFFFLKHRPCRHCIEVYRYLEPILAHLSQWHHANPSEPVATSHGSKKRIYHLRKPPNESTTPNAT